MIGPLKYSAGNLVTNAQNVANMFSNYFSSAFDVPAEDDHIANNDSDTNEEKGSASITYLKTYIAKALI